MGRPLIAIVIAGTILVVLAAALAMGGFDGQAMPAYWHGMGYGAHWGLGMGLGAIAMVLFWGAVIAAVVLLVRAAMPATSTALEGGERPIAILQRHYAAGEIDEATYRKMKDDLGS